MVIDNTGGYNGFHFDITANLLAKNNELMVWVFDPSDNGAQPNGKQRITAITNPGGDTYTPSSGIWQTVWLENVQRIHIDHIRMTTDTRILTLGIDIVGAPSTPSSIMGDSQSFIGKAADPIMVSFVVHDGATVIISGTVAAGGGVVRDIVLPPPVKLWDPLTPFLYGLTLTLNAPGSDSVESYFGMRSFTMVCCRCYCLLLSTSAKRKTDTPTNE
jgi:beta-galactosidase/beta-glucuronidase